MASVRSIIFKNSETILNASISEDEHVVLKGAKDILILPNEFDEFFTTGKLGNSNRVMLPKKVLKKHKIELQGKVPGKIFEVNGRKYLLIKLEEIKIGVPKFNSLAEKSIAQKGEK